MLWFHGDGGVLCLDISDNRSTNHILFKMGMGKVGDFDSLRYKALNV